MPDWSWPVLIGVGIVVGALWFGMRIIRKRTHERREAEHLEEFQRKLQERDAKRDALKAIREASGLWSWWWRSPLERGQIYTLSEHNVSRETKEEREGSSLDGVWLAQTAAHEGSHHSCADCKQLMEAYIEEMTHDYYGNLVPRSTPIGYALLDGTRHAFTIDPRPGSV